VPVPTELPNSFKQDSIMSTLTIIDLPMSRALDYKAMAAIRGAGSTGDWCLFAFQPFIPASDRIVPTVNFFQTNYFADQLNLTNTNIDVHNSGGAVNISTVQNALNIIQGASTGTPS
jgi:hypothetical protein